jgi:hypothetical protein
MAIKINGTSVIDDNRSISSVGVATIGSGNSTTTINGNTGIVNVGTGVTINGITGNISIAGTLTAAGFNVPANVVVFSPANSATGVARTISTIDLTFNQFVGIGTTGFLTIRKNSVDGVAIATVGVSSITSLSAYQLRINIPQVGITSGQTTFYPIADTNFIRSTGGFAGINTGVGVAYSFTTIDFQLSSVNPSDGATNVGIDTNITLTFTSPPIKGTGIIELKSGSATTGTLIESFNVSTSSSITVAGNDFIINPTSNLGFSTTIHTIIPSTAITGYVGLNTTGGNTHSFTTRNPNLGESFGGGYLICQSGGTRWIVAPASSQVSRNWYNNADANTRAQQVTGCTGWFVPSAGSLYNPGYLCRVYWDSYSPSFYWAGNQVGNYSGWTINFNPGATPAPTAYNNSCGKTNYLCIRSFRCVTY